MNTTYYIIEIINANRTRCVAQTTSEEEAQRFIDGLKLQDRLAGRKSSAYCVNPYRF